MYSKKLPLLIILLISLGAVLSYWIYSHYYQPANNIEATGTIEATTYDITAKQYGIIKSISCKEGDKVQKGQLLAEISRDDLRAQRDRDAMGVASAQAHLRDLSSGARSEEITSAAANVNVAQLNLDQAVLDLQRGQGLFDSGALSQQSLDSLILKKQTCQQQAESAQAQLILLKAGPRPDIVAGAAADLDKSKAVLKNAETMLADLSLSSPLDGTIISKNYEQGEYVLVGAAVLSIADLNKLWIKVFIPTNQLPLISLGQKVQVSVSGSSSTFAGKVIEIANQGEFTPKSIQTKQERTHVVYAVKIDIANNDTILKPGMPADIVFIRS